MSPPKVPLSNNKTVFQFTSSRPGCCFFSSLFLWPLFCKCRRVLKNKFSFLLSFLTLLLALILTLLYQVMHQNAWKFPALLLKSSCNHFFPDKGEKKVSPPSFSESVWHENVVLIIYFLPQVREKMPVNKFLCRTTKLFSLLLYPPPQIDTWREEWAMNEKWDLTMTDWMSMARLLSAEKSRAFLFP